MLFVVRYTLKVKMFQPILNNWISKVDQIPMYLKDVSGSKMMLIFEVRYVYLRIVEIQVHSRIHA